MALIDHNVSIELEMAARKALNIPSRGGLYGVIDADYIDRVGRAYTVLVASVSPYYKDGDSKAQAKINNFLEKYYFLGEPDTSKEEYTQGVKEAAKELRKLIDELRK